MTGWATTISAGWPVESNPTLAFQVTGDSDPTLFAVAPAVDAASGTLTYTPAQDAAGTATIDLVLQANGGVDGTAERPPPCEFTINVEAPLR